MSGSNAKTRMGVEVLGNELVGTVAYVGATIWEMKLFWMNRREKMTEQVCDITKLFYIISISWKTNVHQLNLT